MKESEIILYTTPEGNVKVDIRFEEETFWLSQKKMAALFAVDVRTVNEHLKNIFTSGELDKKATIRNFRIVQTEGKREVQRDIEFYNLDAIIAVGYRINSYSATQFRRCAFGTSKKLRSSL
ncbi:MAG: virulence RhuM family protein [Psychroflexus sp.]|nr:virulence RhuM family protein [Psychroflexus sp.]